MRRSLIVLGILVLAVAPLSAQNTDIESLSGLQFNFGNPGARSLGMGGAFLGLADDASAAEANPAGLTILRKPEISVEVRNYLEQQIMTTSGTFPDLERTAFTAYSERVQIAFASAVFPIKNKVTLGAYYHEPLRNNGAGQVLPQRNEFTGQIESDVPNFYLPRNGTPVSAAECQKIVRDTKDFFACLEYTINPFISANDVQQRTWGLAGAWQVHPKFSVGATARFQTFRESAFTFRVDPDFNFSSISVQTTAEIDDAGNLAQKNKTDVTFAVGLKWSPIEQLSFGGVYKKGPSFKSPLYAATVDTNLKFVKVADTQFHIPDIAGVGVSFRPIPVLTINADAVYVKYSNLVDDFVALSDEVNTLDQPFEAADVVELRLGAEYFFATKLPFAVRAGYWRDPAHSTEYVGPLDHFNRVAEAVLFPKGKDQNHFSVGAGFAWPRFQIDFAYDTSETFKVGSISTVTRF